MLTDYMTPVQAVQLVSIILGLSVATFSWSLISVLYREHVSGAPVWEYEALRVRLRKESAIFRGFEPLIDEVNQSFVRQRAEAERNELIHRLEAAGVSSAWKPPELYFAASILEAFFCGIGSFVLGSLLFDVEMGILCLPLGGYGYYELIKKQVKDRAQQRLLKLKSRLPYAIDLMGFMMQAGAGFHEALATVVAENKDHILGEEFATILNEISMGRSRHLALEHLRDRLLDVDINELVFAINKGEEMGTPLSKLLQLQADQLRKKQSQWLEAAAARAQVTIVFPGMLIMLTCLAIVMAPFLLPAMVGNN